MYRLGVNHQQIPVNRPVIDVNNNNQDGSMNVSERNSDVNYEPSRKEPKLQLRKHVRYKRLYLVTYNKLA
jgi:catalase